MAAGCCSGWFRASRWFYLCCSKCFYQPGVHDSVSPSSSAPRASPTAVLLALGFAQSLFQLTLDFSFTPYYIGLIPTHLNGFMPLKGACGLCLRRLHLVSGFPSYGPIVLKVPGGYGLGSALAWVKDQRRPELPAGTVHVRAVLMPLG